MGRMRTMKPNISRVAFPSTSVHDGGCLSKASSMIMRCSDVGWWWKPLQHYHYYNVECIITVTISLSLQSYHIDCTSPSSWVINHRVYILLIWFQAQKLDLMIFLLIWFWFNFCCWLLWKAGYSLLGITVNFVLVLIIAHFLWHATDKEIIV